MPVKFETNVGLTLTFPFGDFLQVDGQYGAQWLYTVQGDKLYTTKNLHEKLQKVHEHLIGEGKEDGLKGTTWTITKIETDNNRKDWKIEYPDADGGGQVAAEPKPAQQAPAASQPAQSPPQREAAYQEPQRPEKPPEVSVDDQIEAMRCIYVKCIVAAEAAATEVFVDEEGTGRVTVAAYRAAGNIGAWATTMFLGLDKSAQKPHITKVIRDQVNAQADAAAEPVEQEQPPVADPPPQEEEDGLPF